MTFHANGIKRRVDELLTDPAWANFLALKYREIRSGQAPFADLVFQAHFAPTIYEAYPYAVIEYGVRLGKIGLLRVNVGEPPHKDVEEKANNAILKKAPEPFAASFTGGAGDQDGCFAWSKQVKADVLYCGDGDHDCSEACRSVVRLSPWRAPFEVGYTSGSRSYAHLIQNGALARWPYGYPTIFVMIVLDSVGPFKRCLARHPSPAWLERVLSRAPTHTRDRRNDQGQ